MSVGLCRKSLQLLLLHCFCLKLSGFILFCGNIFLYLHNKVLKQRLITYLPVLTTGNSTLYMMSRTIQEGACQARACFCLLTSGRILRWCGFGFVPFFLCCYRRRTRINVYLKIFSYCCTSSKNVKSYESLN